MRISTRLDRWVAPACVGVGVAALGYGVAADAGSAARLTAALAELGGGAFAAGLALTLASVGLRCLRWQFIVGGLGHRIGWALQARIYLAGLALSSTPGKLGETSRAALLHPLGVPVPESLAAFVCDRLADVLAVALLGAAGAALIGERSTVLELIAAAGGAGSLGLAALCRSKAGRRWLSRPAAAVTVVSSAPASAAARGHWLARLGGHAGSALGAWAVAWSGWRPLFYVALGAASFGLQALVLALFVARVQHGVPLGAVFSIFASSTLIGAASGAPGGLGTMEAALVWQLRGAGVPLAPALAAVLAMRGCTLWFVWLIGVLALLTFGRFPPRPPR